MVPRGLPKLRGPSRSNGTYILFLAAAVVFGLFVHFSSKAEEKQIYRMDNPTERSDEWAAVGGSVIKRTHGAGKYLGMPVKDMGGGKWGVPGKEKPPCRSSRSRLSAVQKASCAQVWLSYYKRHRQLFFGWTDSTQKLRGVFAKARQQKVPKQSPQSMRPLLLIDVGANQAKFFLEKQAIIPDGNSFVEGMKPQGGAALGAKIIMHEANPEVVSFLKTKCAQMRGDTECQVVPGAVSNASGTASFHKNRQGESHHNQIGSLAFIHYKDSEDEMVEVKVATMDSMYGPNGIMQNALAGRELFPVGDVGAYAVDFLKIDTEGFDGRVIYGATHVLEQTGAVLWECHEHMRAAGTPLEEVVTHLEERFDFETFLLSNQQAVRLSGGYFLQEYQKKLQWQNCFSVRPSHWFARPFVEAFTLANLTSVAASDAPAVECPLFDSEDCQK